MQLIFHGFRFALVAGVWLAGLTMVANRDWVVPTNGDDMYDGGAGVDTIVFEPQVVPVIVDLSSRLAHGEGVGVDMVVNFETVIGGQAGDLIIGAAEDNLLRGIAGDDDISGMEGEDVLEGGPGNDVLAGGMGDDLYRMYFGEGPDHILEPEDGGDDRLVVETKGLDDPKLYLTRWGDALLIEITTDKTRDRIVVWDQFKAPDMLVLESVSIDDKVWDLALAADATHGRALWDCTLFWFWSFCPARPVPAFEVYPLFAPQPRSAPE